MGLILVHSKNSKEKGMSKSDRRRIIERVAEQNGVSVDSVRQKMNQAIDLAMNSTDPKERENFKKLFGEKRPTPEEFILTIAWKTRKRR